MSGRFDIFRQIERLDPERDCQRIMHLSFGYEFCWDSTRALELALYRTYCVPSISGLLDRTGEFYQHTQRRYDDTAILIAEMCEWGYEQGRGREALKRINWAHGHFKIANDDFLYVLSTFIYEPIRWIDRYGWRQTCRNEKLGYYYFWREVGTRMGICDIPPNYEAFEEWSRDYEQKTFRYTETNQRIGAATRDLFASWYPRPLAPVVRQAIYALLDDEMLEAFGFPRPLPGARALIGGVLKLRARITRSLPPRREPNFFTDRSNRTHPQGYEIESLGPPRLIAARRNRKDELPNENGFILQSNMNSGRQELEASWVRTRGHLQNAVAQLPASPVDGEEGGSVERYREWLDHNELELALDELEMLSEANDVEAAFWKFMLKAAQEMNLTDHAKRYQSKAAEL